MLQFMDIFYFVNRRTFIMVFMLYFIYHIYMYICIILYISYLSDCNRLFTEMDGRITSPGWPASYPGSVDCFMNISLPANSNNRIAIYFNSFSIEAHTNCEYDYLEVSILFINKRKHQKKTGRHHKISGV